MKKKKFKALKATLLTKEQLDALPPEKRQAVWEHQQREICRLKHRYLDAASAEVHQTIHDERDKRQRSRVYKCTWCGFFHLTTTARHG